MPSFLTPHHLTISLTTSPPISLTFGPLPCPAQPTCPSLDPACPVATCAGLPASTHFLFPPAASSSPPRVDSYCVVLLLLPTTVDQVPTYRYLSWSTLLLDTANCLPAPLQSATLVTKRRKRAIGRPPKRAYSPLPRQDIAHLPTGFSPNTRNSLPSSSREPPAMDLNADVDVLSTSSSNVSLASLDCAQTATMPLDPLAASTQPMDSPCLLTPIGNAVQTACSPSVVAALDCLRSVQKTLDTILGLTNDALAEATREERSAMITQLHNSQTVTQLARSIKYLSVVASPQPATMRTPVQNSLTAAQVLTRNAASQLGHSTTPSRPPVARTLFSRPSLLSFSSQDHVKYAIYLKYPVMQPYKLIDIFTTATAGLSLTSFKPMDDAVSLYVPLLDRNMLQASYDALCNHRHRLFDGTTVPLPEICKVVRIIKSPYAVKCTRNDPTLFTHWFRGSSIDYSIAKPELVRYNSTSWFPSTDSIREIESFDSVTDGKPDPTLMTIKIHVDRCTFAKFVDDPDPHIVLADRRLRARIEVEIDTCNRCLLTTHNGDCSSGPNCAYCAEPHLSENCTKRWEKKCYNCTLLNQAAARGTVSLHDAKWLTIPVDTAHYAKSGLCPSLLLEKQVRRKQLKQAHSPTVASSSTPAYQATLSPTSNATHATNACPSDE